MAEAVTTLNPVPRARVQAMKEYHPPLGGRDALRLDFNENTLACSPKVREVPGRASLPDRSRAIPSANLLKQPLPRIWASPRRSWLLPMESMRPFTFSSRHFSRPAIELLSVPTYTMYEVYASATDAEHCSGAGR